MNGTPQVQDKDFNQALRLVLVMTRWSTKDLTAMLLKNQKEVKGDQWERD